MTGPLDLERAHASLDVQEQALRVLAKLRAHAGGQRVTTVARDLPAGLRDVTLVDFAALCRAAGMRLVLDVESRGPAGRPT